MRRLTRHPVLLVWLVVVWVGLWGSLTAANVLGGIAVALVVVGALPLTEVEPQDRVNVPRLLVFVGHFAVDLVRSSIEVSVLVLHPRRVLRPAVLAVPVRGESDRLLTLLANAISLTPGTLTLEVDRPRSVLYVHVIDVGQGAESLARVRASLARVERLAVDAVGTGRASA